jgi:hypothetical protein
MEITTRTPILSCVPDTFCQVRATFTTPDLSIAFQLACTFGMHLGQAKDVDADGDTDNTSYDQGPGVIPDLRRPDDRVMQQCLS